MNGAQVIRLNISNQFYNKQNMSNSKAAMGYSFYPATLPLTSLRNHITTGKAFTMGYFQGNHRVSAAFVSAQLLALDLDTCPLSIENVANFAFVDEYSYLVYPSPSSTPLNPKTRVLFVLSEPVTDGMHWRVLQQALIEHMEPLKPDKVCHDPSRFFYGTNTTEYIVNYMNRLPVELAANLIIPFAEREDFVRTEMRFAVPGTVKSDDEMRRLICRWLDTAAQKVGNAPKGGRHKAFLGYAMWLYGLLKGGWPITEDEISRLFFGISIQWGDKDNVAGLSLKWAKENARAIDKTEYRVTAQGKRAGMMNRVSRWQERG